MRLFTSFCILFIALPCTATQEWVADASNSSIKFIASYDGSEFEGQFVRFTSHFTIDTDNSGNSQLKSTIDVTSADTKSRDRDEALAEPDWFYFSKFPQATFISQSIRKLSEDQLEIKGLLKIRDQQKEITFPMQWQAIDDKLRLAQASIPLDRRDYNIGLGEWLEDDTIGFEVRVVFSLMYEKTN